MGRLTAFVKRRRDRIVATTTGLFAHAPYPLTNSLDHRGDPGLFGPDSVTWPVLGDVAAFVGGLRGLLIQAAHPEVVAGVADHSRYREDPLGRLSRTSAYVTATAFGACPEVERAVQVVTRVHRPVKGVSHRERPYAADHSELAAWVHNALTDSFLVAYQVFGAQPMTDADADRFVAEQTKVGALLGADPMPETAAGLAAWVAGRPDAASSPGQEEAIGFLRRPPLPPAVRIGYRVLYWAAAATIPVRLRRILGIRRLPGAIVLGKLGVRVLRLVLGSSPSWHLALVRVDAPIPAGVHFREPLPDEQVAPAFRKTGD